MGNPISVIKTLAIPAVISLILFLLSTHVLIPFYRRYHARYAQYLPLDTISHQTSSLRERITHWIAARHQRFMVVGGGSSAIDDDDDDDDDLALRINGNDDEELTVVDAIAMGGRVPIRGAVREDHTRRLSREWVVAVRYEHGWDCR
jgi:hypothetical protein